MSHWGSILLGPLGNCRPHQGISLPEDGRWDIYYHPHCLRFVPRVSAPWHLWVMPAVHAGDLSWSWREPRCREAERLRLLMCEADSVLGTVYSCRKTQAGRGDIEKGINSVGHTPSWLTLILFEFLSLTTKGAPIMPLTSSSSHRGSHTQVGPARCTRHCPFLDVYDTIGY